MLGRPVTMGWVIGAMTLLDDGRMLASWR